MSPDRVIAPGTDRSSTRFAFGWRRTALRRRWYDIDDDPVLLCGCADGDHTC